MEPLIQKKVIVNGNGHPNSVGFSKKGIKHLFNDTLWRGKGFDKNDLAKLDTFLANGKFVRKQGLYKPRKDDIKRFYYYEVSISGGTFYLNVAEEDDIAPNGKIGHHRYLYSITKRI